MRGLVCLCSEGSWRSSHASSSSNLVKNFFSISLLTNSNFEGSHCHDSKIIGWISSIVPSDWMLMKFRKRKMILLPLDCYLYPEILPWLPAFEHVTLVFCYSQKKKENFMVSVDNFFKKPRSSRCSLFVERHEKASCILESGIVQDLPTVLSWSSHDET